METVTINKDQPLYVLSTDSGYSTLGFSVVRDRAYALAGWLNNSDIKLARPGSKKLYAQYKQLLKAAQKLCSLNNTACNIDLSAQLIGKEGKRVEVITHYGEKRRFIVGKSTGWMPVHLEIKTSRSSGGVAAEKSYLSVKVIY